MLLMLKFCFVFSGHMEQYAGRYSSSAESPTQDWTMPRYQTTSVRETGSADHTSARTACELATLGACNYNYQYYVRKFSPALMGENFIPQTMTMATSYHTGQNLFC